MLAESGWNRLSAACRDAGNGRLSADGIRPQAGRRGGVRMRTRHLVLAMVWLFLPAGAAAQSEITTAVIQGGVVDFSGAVLPGVDVAVRNVDTNFTRALVTDHDGRFVALQVPPG